VYSVQKELIAPNPWVAFISWGFPASFDEYRNSLIQCNVFVVTVVGNFNTFKFDVPLLTMQ